MTEYTAENRVAKKGERIVIVAPNVHDSEDYERGDVFRVDKVDSAGVTTTSGNIVYHEEYEVLPEAVAEEVRESIPEKRLAKTGERIVVVAPREESIGYEQGDIFPVEYVDPFGNAHVDYGNYAVAPDEYEVLPDDFVLNIEDDEPDKPAQIRAACDELRDLLIRKNHDYGDSFAKQYEKYGLMSALIRMDDKMRRLETLVDGQQAQVAESIEDTLADLAGYALLAMVEAKAGRER